MTRRAFLTTSSLALAWGGLRAAPPPLRRNALSGVDPAALLRDWCEGLLRTQIHDPSRPDRHGAFACPACGQLHGRCHEAILPFLHQAEHGRDDRFLAAALRLADWSRNMDLPDGAWNNDPPPVTWKGTTVFGALAWAEALERHGHLLDRAVAAAWRERVRRAGEWIAATIDLDYGNINYGCAGAHALALLGRQFDHAAWRTRARDLARGSLAFFTPKDRFLAGEGRPADKRSPRGCLPVDLGYNVEESLPSLIHYALLTGDNDVLDAVTASLETHLLFLLPDGAWDNSWGTRSAKWSYWGSRTSDGCAAGFVALAPRVPALAPAAERNLRLMARCTENGLLHGGPHYAAHGAPPCVHHTFTHAKAVAGLIHELKHTPGWTANATFPAVSGVRAFPEIATWLVGRGPWRSTITAYDWFYKITSGHPTGGAVSVLHHDTFGPCLSSSQAQFVLVEAHNQQAQPDDEDVPLTPRVEWRAADGTRYATSHDVTATVAVTDSNGAVEFLVEARLVAPDGSPAPGGAPAIRLTHRFTGSTVSLTARAPDTAREGLRFVMPVIASSTDRVQLRDRELHVTRPAGRLAVTCNAPLHRESTRRDRVFQTSPGLQAVPVFADLPPGREVTFQFEVMVSPPSGVEPSHPPFPSR